MFTKKAMLVFSFIVVCSAAFASQEAIKDAGVGESFVRMVEIMEAKPKKSAEMIGATMVGFGEKLAGPLGGWVCNLVSPYFKDYAFKKMVQHKIKVGGIFAAAQGKTSEVQITQILGNAKRKGDLDSRTYGLVGKIYVENVFSFLAKDSDKVSEKIIEFANAPALGEGNKRPSLKDKAMKKFLGWSIPPSLRHFATKEKEKFQNFIHDAAIEKYKNMQKK